MRAGSGGATKRRRVLLSLLALPAALAVTVVGPATRAAFPAGRGGDRATATSIPLLGADWIRFDETRPECHGQPILLHYHERGVRARLRAELGAMRAAGMRALRLFVYHTTAGDGVWLVPSAGGRLPEPYRTNLIDFLDDVRAAGFSTFTLTFNPWAENDPIGYTPIPYDPAKLEENWGLIADLRPLLKAHGPRTTWIDLINEGAPDDWQPRLRDYVSELWRRYADAFGTDDVLVSAIVKSDEGGSTSRLRNLIAALRSTGRGMPAAFQIHPSWSRSGALRDLRAADALLSAEHLPQPILIGEEAYNPIGAARSIAEFVHASRRPVLEVLEWPLMSAHPPSGTWRRCPTSPYRIDAYARALGLTPFLLSGRIDASGASLRSAGTAVQALGAGTYTFVVTDRSLGDGFRLVAGKVVRQTTRGFRGTARWRVGLVTGTTLRYGPLRGSLARIPVLGNGWDGP